MADWPPLRGASFLALFPLYDGSGSLVLQAGGLAASVSKDGAAFAAAACDVAEINTDAGLYTLRFSATEMTADVVAWKVISTSASARPAIGVMYTAASRQLKDLAWPTTTGRSIDVDATGGVEVGTMAASSIVASTFGANAIHAAAVAASTLSSTKLSTGTIVADTLAASVLSSTKLATGTIVADTLGASTITTTKIGTGAIVADTLAASLLGSTKFATGAIVGDTLGASLLTASKFAANSVHAAAVAASSFSASKFGASFLELGGLSNAAASFIGTVVWTGCALAELGVGAPAATPTPAEALMFPYMGLRNSASTSSGCIQFTNNAGTVIAKASISDAASVFDKSEFVSG